MELERLRLLADRATIRQTPESRGLLSQRQGASAACEMRSSEDLSLEVDEKMKV